MKHMAKKQPVKRKKWLSDKAKAYAIGGLVTAGLFTAGGVSLLKAMKKHPKVKDLYALGWGPAMENPISTAAKFSVGVGVGGSLVGRGVQHYYKRSRKEHPKSTKLRALAAGTIKGSVLYPLVAYRDFRKAFHGQDYGIKGL